jgi:hypothetical protein
LKKIQEIMCVNNNPSLNQSDQNFVAGILWIAKITALSVEGPLETDDGRNIPKTLNDFFHLTLWMNGDHVLESNLLEVLESEKLAGKVIIPTPFVVKGTVGYLLS